VVLVGGNIEGPRPDPGQRGAEQVNAGISPKAWRSASCCTGLILVITAGLTFLQHFGATPADSRVVAPLRRGRHRGASRRDVVQDVS
jgi:hypothetical protein